MRPVDFDEEVERRLRAIGTGAAPPVPGAITRYLHQLPEDHPAPVRQGPWQGAGRLSFPRLALGGLVAVAIVVGAVAGTVLMQYRQSGGSGSSAAPATTAASPAATSPLTPEPPSSETPGCTNPPMRSAAAAELVKSGAVIVWERNGGPGCVDELYAAYPDGRTVSDRDGVPQKGQVTSAGVQAVMGQITDAGFFTDLFFTTYHPPCSACHQHSVTVTYGSQTKTVGIVEGGTDGPAQYWIVIGYLSDLFGVAS